MRKLEIDLVPATKAQVNIDFSGDLEKPKNPNNSVQVLLVEFPGRSGKSKYLTGETADAINLKNIQFQNIEHVKSISLIVTTDIAGNVEQKEYDLSPYNTMDAFQREKITIDGSITVRKGTKVYVKFDGVDRGTEEDPLTPSCVMFADLTRYYCC